MQGKLLQRKKMAYLEAPVRTENAPRTPETITTIPAQRPTAVLAYEAFKKQK